MWKKRLGALALTAALTLSLAVPAFAAEDTDPSPAETAPLTREESAAQAAGYAAQYGAATAVSYAVWEDGKITLTGSVGTYSKTENRAILDDDLYGIGSVSKVYTTAAMMKLVEQGKVKLDSPVTKYLPDFKMADERYKDITVRMLLNHSSGLMGGSTNGAFLFADPDQTATHDLLNRLADQRLKADPGEIAVYCNDGFTLAELVIEKVSGKTFGDFVHEYLLKPAGLDDTFVPQDDFDVSRLVKTYASAADTRALAQNTVGVVGTGGVYASASDLAAFGGALTGTKLLTQKSLDAMANAEYERGIWAEDAADSFAYGLGWDNVSVYPFALDGVQALTKGGDVLTYHAALVVIPEYHMAAAVLSSGGASSYNGMAANMMLIDALKEQGVEVTQTVPALPEAAPADMPAELADFSGYYGSIMQQMEAAIADNGLTLRSLTYPAVPAVTYAYYDDGTFRDEANTTIIKPVVEENGVTYLYQKAWGEIPGLGLAAVSNYLGEKLPENTVSPEVQAAWDRLKTMPSLPVSLKYTDQTFVSLFAANAAAAATGTPEYIPGYLGASRIIDETTARNELRIPNMAGRDSQDMTVFEENGVTCYTTNQGLVFADAEPLVQNIYAGPGSYSTVGENGWSRWYMVDGNAAGKTMTVTLPEHAGFYVYDAAGSVTASSAAYGDTTAVLPADGYIVFTGDPGARFYLSFTATAE